MLIGLVYIDADLEASLLAQLPETMEILGKVFIYWEKPTSGQGCWYTSDGKLYLEEIDFSHEFQLDDGFWKYVEIGISIGPS